MNLDKEMKKLLFEKNGLNEEGSTDKIQKFLVESWERKEKQMRRTGFIVKSLWIFIIVLFMFVIVFKVTNENIEDLFENSLYGSGVLEFLSILPSLLPILLYIILIYSIIYWISSYLHKRQFDSMANQSSLNKRLERIEALMEQLVE